MQIFYEIASIIFFILSFIAFALYLTVFTHKNNLAHQGNNVLFAMLILNIVSIFLRLQIVGKSFLFDFAGTILILMGIILIMYFLINYLRNIEVMGAFISPVCFLASGYLLITFASGGKLLPHLRNSFVALHVIIILLSYALFFLAFIASLLYLFQERLLKTKQKGHLLKKLPSLRRMEIFSFHAVSLGQVLLTLGLITGGIISQKIPHSFNIMSPKGIAAIFTWILYTIYILLHFIKFFSAKKSAYILVGGFLVLLITYFGTSHGLIYTP